MKKSLVIVLTIILVVSLFTACGKSVPGETTSWGNLTVLVPDGFTFSKGSLLNETDENAVRLMNDDNYKFNITLILGKAGDGEEHVETNRMFNSSYVITDISDYKTGSYTWKGIRSVKEDDDSWTAYALYTTLKDGRDLMVSMSVTPGGDRIAKAVLASVEAAPAA